MTYRLLADPGRLFNTFMLRVMAPRPIGQSFERSLERLGALAEGRFGAPVVTGTTTTPRVRIAPSPTGPLHIGTARTALFNYLFARRTRRHLHPAPGGHRRRALDPRLRARHPRRPALAGHRLGRGSGGRRASRRAGRSARTARCSGCDSYREAAERLLAEDKAYYCYCTPEELDADRKAQEAAHAAAALRRPVRAPDARASEPPAKREGRKPVIRFRVGEGIVEFDDIVRGHVEIDTTALGGDLVIVRSDGTPLYHFTVCVDDAEMEISHVIRGEDHLSNTPKHILLFRALGAAVPAVRAPAADPQPRPDQDEQAQEPDRGRRLPREGFIREALVNYLALLGWSSGTEEEIFSLDELAERFDLERVHQGGAVFDRERLEWLNGQWIRALVRRRPGRAAAAVPVARRELGRRPDRCAMPTADDAARPCCPMIRERLPTLAAIGALVDFLFVDEFDVDPALLVPKRWDARDDARGPDRRAPTSSPSVGEVSFEADELEPPLRELAEERGWKAGDLFMAIRVAVTGRTATPPLFDTLVALGRERTLRAWITRSRRSARLTGRDGGSVIACHVCSPCLRCPRRSGTRTGVAAWKP